MATTNFVSEETIIEADWLNEVDAFIHDLLGGPETLAELWTAIGSAVAVTGGTINSAAIGGTTPAAGAFTTLSATGAFEAGTTGIIGSTSVSPDGTFHIHTATAGTVTANSSVDDLVVENSGTTGMTLLCPDASQSYYAFGTPSSAVGAYVRWDYTNAALTISTASTSAGQIVFRGLGSDSEIARFDENGWLGIGIGNPDGTLHVHTSSAGTVTAPTNADGIVVEKYTATGISILGGDAQASTYNFGSPSMAQGAIISWGYNLGKLNLRTFKSGSNITLTSQAGDASQFDGDSTAGNTRMLVWDVDTGALVRVSVGADDSGGSGYKVLRVPN